MKEEFTENTVSYVPADMKGDGNTVRGEPGNASLTQSNVADPIDQQPTPILTDAVLSRDAKDSEFSQSISPLVHSQFSQSFNIGRERLITYQAAIENFDHYSNPLLNSCTQLMAILTSMKELRPVPNIGAFRSEIAKSIVDLNYKIIDLDYPVAVAEKLCLLFCIALDEAALAAPIGKNSGWSNRTLVADLFGFRDGGEKFYEITEKALLQPRVLRDFLEVIYLMLKMGYRGKYPSEAEMGRQRIIDRVERAVFTNREARSLDNLLGGREVNKSWPPRQALPLWSKLAALTLFVLLSSGLVFGLQAYWTNKYKGQLEAARPAAAENETKVYVYSSKTGRTEVEVIKK